MKIIKYGIILSRIREEDIETVRNWRNDPVVVANYEFREYITPEMQKAWFESISNIHNIYTIIEYNGEQVGVVNLKHIDWEKQTGEGGIFIPDRRHHETPVPSIVTFMTTELMMDLFRFSEARAHVLRDNKPNQAFVKQLGYELVPGQESAGNQEYRLTRERFDACAPKIRKAITVLTGDDSPVRFVVEPHDSGDELVRLLEESIKTKPGVKLLQDSAAGRIYAISY